MKFLNKILIIFAVAFGTSLMFSQKVTTQEIQKPSEGKSLVYFLRTGAGPLLNFRIYDNDKFLGALSGFKYMVYECEPGKHMFWAASENRDYVEADLEPNGVYVINAEGQMGAFIASVGLIPLNPNEFRDKRTFYQVVKMGKRQDYTPQTADKTENIQKGLERYKDLKANKAAKIKFLDPSWKFENADKPEKTK
ncbi:hypothetical protein EIH07_11190 [Chryseobacterium taklimakanense]|uniref:hypothetical protein n=1 Tax=Chryseobacterium taklimakanense TaxID=536441 RepID=UPI000F5E1F29|nr:hypothetical protein [Chryseobacterium taklimakanense]AZI23556.1 hypothetical protein EIH07_11190 [Chryseobacterium taklimakanense]